MAFYRVEYRDAEGRCQIRGAGPHPPLEAQSEQEVRALLRQMGARSIIRIERIGGARWKQWLSAITRLKFNFRMGATLDEYSLFCSLMHTLLSAGVPLTSALRLLGEEFGNDWLVQRIHAVQNDVETEGSSLSAAMMRQKSAFPLQLITAVQAGERIGNLKVSFEKMMVLFRQKAEIRRQLINAMIYPALMIVVFLVMCVVIIVLIPRALENFLGDAAEMKTAIQQMPFQIRMLFYIRAHPVILIYPPLFLAFLIGLMILLRRFKPFRLYLNRLRNRIPFLGRMIYLLILSDFLETLSLNQESGMPLSDSLALIRQTISCDLFKDALERVRDRLVNEGRRLSEALREEIPLFPPLMCQMVEAAESSGKLSETIRPLAAIYLSSAHTILDRLMTLFPQILLLVLGSFIGWIIVGVYVALTKMPEMMQR